MTTEAAISVVPANEASWDDLRAVFGARAIRPGASASGTGCCPGILALAAGFAEISRPEKRRVVMRIDF